MLRREVHSPLCSSVGRLFDGVAALAGLRQVVRYEGRAAMELEFALEGARIDEVYALRITGGRTEAQPNVQSPKSQIILDGPPMIGAILEDVRLRVSAGEISARFHNALVEAIVKVAQGVGERRVVLCGGCFQNRYLTERAVMQLRVEGFQPYWHQRVPPNDGGIALGQIVAARRVWGAAVRSSA